MAVKTLSKPINKKVPSVLKTGAKIDNNFKFLNEKIENNFKFLITKIESNFKWTVTGLLVIIGLIFGANYNLQSQINGLQSQINEIKDNVNNLTISVNNLSNEMKNGFKELNSKMDTQFKAIINKK